MIRLIFDKVCSDRAAKPPPTLQPKAHFIVMFHESGITQEHGDLRRLSNLEDQEAGTATPDCRRRRCQ